eukprot:Gb_30434 [translate_table: standard]
MLFNKVCKGIENGVIIVGGLSRNEANFKSRVVKSNLFDECWLVAVGVEHFEFVCQLSFGVNGCSVDTCGLNIDFFFFGPLVVLLLAPLRGIKPVFLYDMLFAREEPLQVECNIVGKAIIPFTNVGKSKRAALTNTPLFLMNCKSVAITIGIAAVIVCLLQLTPIVTKIILALCLFDIYGYVSVGLGYLICMHDMPWPK